MLDISDHVSFGHFFVLRVSDAMEDPIQTAIKAGFVDLSSSDPSYPRVSSYVFKVNGRYEWSHEGVRTYGVQEMSLGSLKYPDLLLCGS